jgi:hypothetical protein
MGDGAVNVLEIVGPRAADDDLIVQNPEASVSHPVATGWLGAKVPKVNYPIAGGREPRRLKMRQRAGSSR